MIEHTPQRILLCDDDAAFRRRLKRSLSQLGFEIFEAENAEDALRAQRDYAPDSAVVDLRMPGQSGLWLVGELRKYDSKIAIVVLTGFGSISTALDAIRSGAINYLTKPVSSPLSLLPPPRPRHHLRCRHWRKLRRSMFSECSRSVMATSLGAPKYSGCIDVAYSENCVAARRARHGLTLLHLRELISAHR